MTLKLFKNSFNIDSDDKDELLALADKFLEEGKITLLDYAHIKADINSNNRTHEPTTGTPTRTTTRRRTRYSDDEVRTVLRSHLDVYDGIKDISAHLNLMKQLFGESSSQFRNGIQYNKGFHRTLNEGDPNLGQSMPANWADATLELIHGREPQFQNTLSACQKIYDATNNGNMLKVIQKWTMID